MAISSSAYRMVPMAGWMCHIDMHTTSKHVLTKKIRKDELRYGYAGKHVPFHLYNWGRNAKQKPPTVQLLKFMPSISLGLLLYSLLFLSVKRLGLWTSSVRDPKAKNVVAIDAVREAHQSR